MALWQYDLYLIPQARVAASFHPLPHEVTDEQGRALHWNGDYQPPEDYVQLLTFLEPTSSWDPDIAVWGDQLGNRIDVTTRDGQVTTIFARIDARDNSASPFVLQLVAFAHHCGGMFMTYEGHLVPSAVPALLADLQQSPARRFAQKYPAAIEQVLDSEPD